MGTERNGRGRGERNETNGSRNAGTVATKLESLCFRHGSNSHQVRLVSHSGIPLSELA